MNNLLSVVWLKKGIYITISLTDFCNFSCEYCVTWKKFTWNSLIQKNQEKIYTFLSDLNSLNSTESINITLSWWEPTLHKDFFSIINKILTFNKVNKININTNWYILYKKKIELLELSKNNNFKKLYFNITYHFNQYNWNEDLFIESIKNLIYLNIKFWINFIIPDNIELSSFLFIRDKIINKTWIWKLDYNYSLIKDSFWKKSSNYSDDVLNFYEKNLILWEKRIKYVFSNNEKKYEHKEIIDNWLNLYSWYKCFYTTKEYTWLNIDIDWSCAFWCCYTLYRLKYKFNEIIKLINSWDKFVICWDHACLYEFDYYKKKIFNENSTLLNNILFKKFKKKDFWDFILNKIIIWHKNNIQFVFSFKDLYLFIIVERIIDDNQIYIYKNKWLWYHFFVRNNNNEFIQDFNNKNVLFIINYFKLFDSLFNKILI